MSGSAMGSGSMIRADGKMTASTGLARERELNVYALGDNERPLLETPLYAAPYWNIYGNQHHNVCLGTMVLPKSLEPEQPGAWTGAFFASNFAHLSGTKCWAHPGTYAELLAEPLRWGGLRASGYGRPRWFWCKIEDDQRPGGWNSGKMSKRSSLDELFKGRHFLAEVIVVSVRWYLEYKLSSRDISRLMAEREISIDHSTILRWVRRYAPEFEKKWHRYAHLIGPSWRVDETYVKVGCTWTYLYRGVDKSGKSTVSYLSRNRTVGAAKTYLRKV
jgi:hypothetical protein